MTCSQRATWARGRCPCSSPSRADRRRARSRSTSPTPASAARICTSLHGDMDARVTAPAVLGHEMSRHDRRARRGRRRLVGPAIASPSCRSTGAASARPAGRATHICQQPELHRHRLPRLDAERAGPCPATRSSRCPPALASTAALVEPTAVAVHDVRRADLAAGREVARRRRRPDRRADRPRRPRAPGRTSSCSSESAPQRRALAASSGCDVVDPAAADVPALVDDWTDGAGADVGFEVSGSAAGLDAADPPAGRPRAARRRRDPPDAAAGRPVPRLLARADAPRRPRLRARRLRAGDRAARERRVPLERLITQSSR